MKRLLISLLLTIFCNVLVAQNIGINTAGTAPNNSAGLDVDFTNKGLLIPRVGLTSSLDATTISSPATSLLIYNTATAGSSPNNVTPGYYYWTGTVWTRLATSGASATNWQTNGNAGTISGTNFIGTTDAQDLSVKTNNFEKLRVTTTGRIGVNESSPTATMYLKTYINGDLTNDYDGVKLVSPVMGPMYSNGTILGIDNGTASGVMGRNAQLWNFEPGFLRFGTANYERLKIDQFGNFGFNESNPAAASTVTIRPFINGSTGAPFDGVRIIHPMFAPSTLSGLLLGVDPIGQDATITSYQAGNLTFGTATQERMRLTPMGTLAIGATNISSTGLATLVMQDNTGGISPGTMLLNPGFPPGTKGMYYGADMFGMTNNGKIWNYLFGDVILGTNNSEVMRLSSTGRVGVKTTTPTFDLDVNGNANFTGPVRVTGYTLPIMDGMNGQVIKTDGSGNLSWSSLAAGTVSLVDLYMPNSVFNVSGGPVTSTGTFNVTFDTQSANTVFAGPTSGSPGVPDFRPLVAADIPTLTGYIQNNTVGNNFGTGQAASFDITGNGEISGNLKLNGNLGLGTTTPSERLHIANGNLRIDDGYYIKSSSGTSMLGMTLGDIQLSDNSFGGRMIFNLRSSTGIDFQFSSASDNGRFAPNGFLGLGTTTPSERLHIANGNLRIDDGYYIKSSSGTSMLGMTLGDIQLSDNSFGGRMIFNLRSSTGIDFQFSSASDNGRFAPNGFLGLGTTTPSERLEVNGRIKVGAYVLPSTDGTSGQVLKTNGSGTLTWQNDNGGSGTVTSVALSMPSIFSVSGSPVTTSGTLTASLNTQAANTFFAGPSSGAAATPTFRAITATDIPTLSGYIQNNAVGNNFATGQAASFDVTGNAEVGGTLEVNGNVGIGTTTTNSTLEVNGAVAMKVKTAQVAGTNNPDNTGEIWLYTSGSGAITLPAAATCPNRMYVILNNTGAVRTISSYKDLALTAQTTINNNTSLWIVSDGANWQQIK